MAVDPAHQDSPVAMAQISNDVFLMSRRSCAHEQHCQRKLIFQPANARRRKRAGEPVIGSGLPTTLGVGGRRRENGFPADDRRRGVKSGAEAP